MSATAKPLLAIYDGQCTLCERARRFAHTLDWRQRLAFTDLHDRAAVQREVPNLSPVESQLALHLRLENGQMLCGFAAVRRMMRVLPLLAPLAWCLYVPPLNIIGEQLYRLIAQHRPCKAERSSPA
ncbi:MAG: DUF393 domain-containing protein [Chloroflexi bacterium]|nr:DUF393 domain-containing protein [Chloroflexota bacterium]